MSRTTDTADDQVPVTIKKSAMKSIVFLAVIFAPIIQLEAADYHGSLARVGGFGMTAGGTDDPFQTMQARYGRFAAPYSYYYPWGRRVQAESAVAAARESHTPEQWKAIYEKQRLAAEVAAKKKKQLDDEIALANKQKAEQEAKAVYGSYSGYRPYRDAIRFEVRIRTTETWWLRDEN